MIEANLAWVPKRWETVFLQNYYEKDDNIEYRSTQYLLRLAVIQLDRSLTAKLRTLTPEQQFEFYNQTVKPINLAYIMLMSQLEHKGILTQDKKLSELEIKRYLKRINDFNKVINKLPNVHPELMQRLKNLLTQFKVFLFNKKCALQGKPKPIFVEFYSRNLPKAINKFVQANKQVIGVCCV